VDLVVGPGSTASHYILQYCIPFQRNLSCRKMNSVKLQNRFAVGTRMQSNEWCIRSLEVTSESQMFQFELHAASENHKGSPQQPAQGKDGSRNKNHAP